MIVYFDTEDWDSVELFIRMLPEDWNLAGEYLEDTVIGAQHTLRSYGTEKGFDKRTVTPSIVELKLALQQFAESL